MTIRGDRTDSIGTCTICGYFGPGPRHDCSPRVATVADRDVKPDKPTHYKVVCISMYTSDIEQLEAKVAELKRRGWTKANKSQLIRLALAQLDLDTLPEPVR
jgi:hypothetical protein